MSSRDYGTNAVLFVGGAGNDTITDHLGQSTAQFSGAKASYSIVINGDGSVTVTDLRDGSPDGTDTLRGVDVLRFSNGDFLPDGTRISGNSAPVGANDSYSVNEDATLTIAGLGVLANDEDEDGDALTAILVAGPTNGTLTLNADGSFVYTPNADYHGSDSFTYRANDGEEAGNLVTVTITVNSVNDAPTAPIDSDATGDGSGDVRASISEHLTVGSAIGITANSTDVDGDGVQYYFKDGDGNRTQALGFFIIDATTGIVTLANEVNFELAASHSIKVFASDGTLESSSSFTVDVQNVVEHLFTSGNDSLDFNLLAAGAYDVDGAEYNALAGDDFVILPTLATSALAGHAWNYATTFDAGDGNDTVEGRDGADRVSGGLGNDILRGGAGADLLSGDDGDDSLHGGDGDDTLNGGDGADQLHGEAGDDTINGDGGNDSIWGGVGNDTLSGGGGADLVHGDDGNDSIDGGAGADTLHGGVGNDTIAGGADNDLIYGGVGADTLAGDGGNDSVYGGDGNDTLRGGDGDDLLFGELNDDWIYGGTGNDQLDGGLGNDKLFGGTGADRLVGGSGDDILAGGAGADKLTGSSGKDIFIFTDSEIGTTKIGAHDVITDFQQGTDKIDVSALLDAGFYTGLKAGALKGLGTDQYKVGFYSEGGKTWVEGDTNGDGRADFVIEMSGSYKLTNADMLVSASVITAQAQWASATGGLDYNHFHQDSLWI
jgi:Ca2+-binding RTX toxin-like protein